MLVVWVLDTSASMNQRAHGGLTLLDCAKSAIEHFLKVLQDSRVVWFSSGAPGQGPSVPAAYRATFSYTRLYMQESIFSV